MAYHTIVVDPPWHYDSRRGGSYGDARRATNRPLPRRESFPYPTMTVSAITALPIAAIAEPDAHLYLWTTQKYLRDAFAVLDAWGFRCHLVLTWSKRPKGVGTGPFISSSEFVLVGLRGSLRPFRKHLGTVFTWPRNNVHSQKPDHFYDLVEQISPGPYVELFARRHRLGWDVWGNESANTASLAASQT